MEKPGRKKGFDPKRRKARDNARQRKIVANSSDKSFRRGAPLVKAMANRKVRRTAKVRLNPDFDENADTVRQTDLRLRDRHWGTENAAKRREAYAESRAYWDANPDESPKKVRRRKQIQFDAFLKARLKQAD